MRFKHKPTKIKAEYEWDKLQKYSPPYPNKIVECKTLFFFTTA